MSCESKMWTRYEKDISRRNVRASFGENENRINDTKCEIRNGSSRKINSRRIFQQNWRSNTERLASKCLKKASRCTFALLSAKRRSLKQICSSERLLCFQRLILSIINDPKFSHRLSQFLWILMRRPSRWLRIRLDGSFLNVSKRHREDF